MNKIYGLIVIFAFAGLLLPTTAIQTEAASDLDFMLKIGEKAQKYIKAKIDEMENKNSQDWENRKAVLDIYNKSSYELEQLSAALDKDDRKSAGKIFVSFMDKIKQISLMLNQIAENKVQETTPIHTETIKRYEMNIQKLKQISEKLGADIDFSVIDNLLLLAKQNAENDENEKAKDVINQIAMKGVEINKVLYEINEKNKIIRAQALAQKYVDRINALIVEAKTSELPDYVQKLEHTKLLLISSNNTSQITKNISIVITINNDIKEINKNNLKQIDIDEIRLSQTQKITVDLNQLETKAKFLYSNAGESKVALYYAEKALAIIDNVRSNIDEPQHRIDAKLNLIEKLLSKVSRILQDST